MNGYVLQTLEFDKVRSMLAGHVGSALGRHLVERLTPVNDIAQVQERLVETSEATDVFLASVTIPLGGIRDISIPLKKVRIGGMLDIEEIVAVGSTLYASRRVKTFFKELTAVDAPGLARLADGIVVLRDVEQLIDQTINEQGGIRDDASGELQRIRREVRQAQARVKDKLDATLRSTQYQKYFQDALVTMRGDRYVIPIKQEYRHHFPGIVHDQSASGATVFIEPMAIVTLNNDIKQLLSAEKNEIERILQMVSARIGVNVDNIESNCGILAQLDFAFAKARLGRDMKAVMPEINTLGVVNLRQARHPLIDSAVVVPTDIDLGERFHTLLITGPNTGGKTVTMKTLGLLALMTQAGLFIPADSGSKMPVFGKIFADIGDEQSIEQSLSTFSGHMTNIVQILEQVSPHDLVLMDEVGAGTDPEEGAALAMAILEHLMDAGVKTVATTHYSELKTFAYSRPGIENASVEFDIATLRPTYRLLIGIPGSSNAFAISNRLGLSGGIIDRAKQLLDKDHAELAHILNDLEAKKLYYERLNQQMFEQKIQFDAGNRRILDEQRQLDEKKELVLRKAQSDAAMLIRQARRQAEAVISELKAQFNSTSAKQRQQSIDASRKLLRDHLGDLSDLGVDDDRALPVSDPALLTVGSNVYIATLNQKGQVIAAGSDQVTVQVGLMKVNVPVASCRLTTAASGVAAPPKVKEQSKIDFKRVSSVVRQIDIRGTNVEEAEFLLEKFFDDAVLAGLTQVLVIHGKGTGALRKGIRAYLKAHHQVADIAIAELNEGGDGATVVYLK